MTTPPDFRALCDDLADRLQRAITSSKADYFYHEDRDAIDAARAALSTPPLGSVTDDAEDAALFRLWIEEASLRPCRLALTIMNCLTPDDYRHALRAVAAARRCEDSRHV
jgi:hypothetical protein